MNKHTLIAVLTALVCVGVAAYVHMGFPAAQAPSTSVSNQTDAAIRTTVAEFGSTLKNISLLGPQDEVARSMQKEYGSYLTPQLLTSWQRNPAEALGRQTSSPWPDRIDVASITEKSPTLFVAEGNVIEVANAGTSTAPVAVYPVTLTLEKQGDTWLISQVLKGDYSTLPQRTTVIGYWECLPHRNTSGPQTAECAFGIALDQSDGHLAVSTSLLSSYPVDFPTGTKVKIEGIITPANELNSNTWQKYDIDGIIAATSIVPVK